MKLGYVGILLFFGLLVVLIRGYMCTREGYSLRLKSEINNILVIYRFEGSI